MTLTLELSRETESWLETEAAKQGVDPGEFALHLIEIQRQAQSVPPAISETERLAAIDAAMGAFAHVPTSSEMFACHKQEEIELEEAKFARRWGSAK